MTTLSSLMKFKETREPYCGPTDEYTAGNGVPFYSPIAGYWDRNPVVSSELVEVINGSFKQLNPPDIMGSGYVLKALEAALWASTVAIHLKKVV